MESTCVCLPRTDAIHIGLILFIWLHPFSLEIIVSFLPTQYGGDETRGGSFATPRSPNVICMTCRQALKQLSVTCILLLLLWPIFHLLVSHNLVLWTLPSHGHPSFTPPHPKTLTKGNWRQQQLHWLLCGCHGNHRRFHMGLTYRMAVMDWTLGGEWSTGS